MSSLPPHPQGFCSCFPCKLGHHLHGSSWCFTPVTLSMAHVKRMLQGPGRPNGTQPGLEGVLGLTGLSHHADGSQVLQLSSAMNLVAHFSLHLRGRHLTRGCPSCGPGLFCYVFHCCWPLHDSFRRMTYSNELHSSEEGDLPGKGGPPGPLWGHLSNHTVSGTTPSQIPFYPCSIPEPMLPTPCLGPVMLASCASLDPGTMQGLQTLP